MIALKFSERPETPFQDGRGNHAQNVHFSVEKPCTVMTSNAF